MITSLLIANRGEIARRVIRTCGRLGVRSVAVYSVADANAPHVREADEAALIGPAPARESYLSIDAILAAARDTGVQGIHPGYGFLSENADFAEAVIAAGLIWIGPPPKAIRAMGPKDQAKRLMAAAGVPVTPGYLGDDQTLQTLVQQAEAIGWPIMIKAVAGGGGKGMRAVHSSGEFPSALASAQREGASSFGDDRVLLEKLIATPRHIEVQVFADQHGGAVHLFERDCSLQRRHQKVIEEAPAPGMTDEVRRHICGAAVRAARAVDYVGAGTVEFIADGSEGLRADRFWFMEMNTRLQVEHPVTEAVTGLDLVEWQLRVASGEALPLTQDKISLNGHAMEARLYAEDPSGGFLPSVGPLRHLRLPHAIRVDSGVEEGGSATPYYDPMLAKLIAHGPDRQAAARMLAEGAESVEVWPVKSNAAFLARCVRHPEFLSGLIDTGFIDRHLPDLIAAEAAPIPPGVMAHWLEIDGDLRRARDCGPWAPLSPLTGFRVNGAAVLTARAYLDGEAVDVALDPDAAPEGLPDEDGSLILFAKGSARRLSLARPAQAGGSGPDSDGVVLTPMPGRIVAVAVTSGQAVEAGATLMILEAMKMEHALVAPRAGRVSDLTFAVGDQVSEGVVAARLLALDAPTQ